MHPSLRAAAERRLGVFTAAEARAAGYRPDEVRRACSSGHWTRLRRGVYAVTDDLTRTEARGGRHAVDCLAVLALLQGTDAVVSHSSAARVWGWPLRRDLDPTVRLTGTGVWRRGDGWLLTRAPLPLPYRTARGPVPLTSPARTLVDCAREWPLEDAVVAMDAALLRRQTTAAALAEAAGTAHHWPGAPRAVRAVALADGRAESPLETRGRLRVVGSGLPVFQPQVEIRHRGRLVAVVDGWYDDAAVAVEFDGKLKYTDAWRGRSPGQVAWEEKRREDALRALDIDVVRIADADLGSGWAPVEERLRRLLSRPGPAVRRFETVPREHGVPRSA